MNQLKIWLVLGFAFVVPLIGLLVRNKGLEAKKWYAIGIIISIDVLMMVLLISWHATLKMILYFVLFFFVTTLICIKSIKVCEACGQDIYIKRPFDRNKYCMSCNMGVKHIFMPRSQTPRGIVLYWY